MGSFPTPHMWTVDPGPGKVFKLFQLPPSGDLFKHPSLTLVPTGTLQFNPKVREHPTTRGMLGTPCSLGHRFGGPLLTPDG